MGVRVAVMGIMGMIVMAAGMDRAMRAMMAMVIVTVAVLAAAAGLLSLLLGARLRRGRLRWRVVWKPLPLARRSFIAWAVFSLDLFGLKSAR